MALGELDEGVEEGDAVFRGGREVAADRAELFGGHTATSRSAGDRRRAQVAVDRFVADAELLGERRLPLPGGGALAQLLRNAGADQIFGDAGSDTINGGGGADALNGGAGTDTVNGGAGADTLEGGPGNDQLNGGAGNDTLTDTAGNADVGNGGAGNADRCATTIETRMNCEITI